MDDEEQKYTRGEIKMQIEENVDFTMCTINLMLDNYGRQDLIKSIKKKDWRCIKDVMKSVRSSIMPEGDVDADSLELLESYETLLMFYMGILPSSYSDIPVVLRNIQRWVKHANKSDFDELIQHYESQSGESILGFVSKCTSMFPRHNAVVVKSLTECSAITLESVEPTMEIDEESDTMCKLIS